MKQLALFIFTVCSFYGLHAQAPARQVNAVRTTEHIKIDGVIDEEAWKTASVITDLVEMRPTFGQVEDKRNRSELFLLYDDKAIYFGGTLYESSVDSISTELAGRDAVGINDFVGIIFDTYQDKINGLGFFVTPLGEQYDAKYSIGGNGGEDASWNAVYH